MKHRGWLNIMSSNKNKEQDLPAKAGGLGDSLINGHVGTFFVFVGLGLLVFANTFGNAWTYDDFPVIVDNPDVRSWSAFLLDSYPGRPLRELTYLFDYQLFGLDPRGWHFQNIFWHGLNAWLLLILAGQLTGKRVVAWLAALIFLLHPLQVEVVANISHRKDSLALAFVMLAFLAYRKALDTPEKRSRLLVFAVIAWGCGVFAKQVAVMLPLILASYEFLLVPVEKRLLCRRCSWLLGVVGLVIPAVVGWLAFFGGRDLFFRAIAINIKKYNVFGEVGVVDYYATVLAYLGRMVVRLFWPLDLAAEYTYPVAGLGADPWAMVGVCASVIAVVGLLLFWNRRPSIAFCLLWTLIFWLPVSNLWPLVYMAADRYWYLPMAGISLLLAFAMNYLCSGRRLVLITAGLMICAALAVLTWQQNRVWASPQTLWTHAVSVSPSSPFALNNMGNVYLLKGDTDKAMSYYLRARNVNPYNPTAHYNLGLIYEQRMQLRQARNSFLQFLERAGEDYAQDKGKVRKHLQQKYGLAPSQTKGY